MDEIVHSESYRRGEADIGIAFGEYTDTNWNDENSLDARAVAGVGAHMETIFTVHPEDIDRFSPEEAVAVFRGLLWAEAARLGIEAYVDVPSNIDARDGGIDAEVRANTVTDDAGLIRTGRTFYQIKTGRFGLAQSDIRSLVCRRRSRRLKPRVKDCLANGNTFAAIFFGYDSPDEKTNDQCAGDIRDFIGSIEPRFAKANIDVWRANRISELITTYHPALALRIKGWANIEFRTHEVWSRYRDMDRRQFQPDATQAKLIDDIRSRLRQPDRRFHIHLTGAPGVGKTRTVLEATREDSLSPRIIYCDRPSLLLSGQLSSAILHADNRFHGIVVVDDCPATERAEIANMLEQCSERISIVTIDHDPAGYEPNTALFQADNLEESTLTQILVSYNLPSIEAQVWAQQCGGSPRVAHAIGEYFRDNPGEVFKPGLLPRVWDRFIAGRAAVDGQGYTERKLVLSCIALFRRFGSAEKYPMHCEMLQALISVLNPSLGPGSVRVILREFRARRVLQGEYVLYIAPQLLHVYLWDEFWRLWGNVPEVSAILKSLPRDLKEWHDDMYEYAAGSDATQRRVAELLGLAGSLDSVEDLEEEATTGRLLTMARSDPRATISALQRTVGRASRPELEDLKKARRSVIDALEWTARWRGCFGEAARLLLALAEAENEPYVNNATGIFAGLFRPISSHYAPIETPPAERLPYLREALQSDSIDRRLVGIKACFAALERSTTFQIIDTSITALAKRPQHWVPKSEDEVLDFYEAVWNDLCACFDDADTRIREAALDVVKDQARGIASSPRLTPVIQDTLTALSERGVVDKASLLEIVSDILHYDGKRMTTESRSRWEALREELTGTDFGSRLRRYVGMLLMEDQFDDQRNFSDRTAAIRRRLARELISDPQLLKDELAWLLSPEAIRAQDFGFDLGTEDRSWTLQEKITRGLRDVGGTAALFGGYLRAMNVRDRDRWDAALECAAADSTLVCMVPELTARSGVTDTAALRVLSLAKQGVLTKAGIELYSNSGFAKYVPESVVADWLAYLVGQQDRRSVACALRLSFEFYIDENGAKQLPGPEMLTLICHQSLSDPNQDGGSQLLDYYWERVALEYVVQHPESTLPIASMMIEHFGQANTIIPPHGSTTQRVINAIVERYPAETWSMISTALEMPDSSRTSHITQWLRGGSLHQMEGGALCLFPAELIWEWVDESPEKRASFVAYFVPPRLFREEGRLCLAREFLARYGHLDGVASTFHANYGTESYSGPASRHYDLKKRALEKFREDESSESVTRWLDKEIESLGREIERAKVDEESHGLDRL